MAAPRRVIALVSDAAQRQRLREISRSRTEPESRVERARIILAYLAEPSADAVARAVGVTQQTVGRCLERAAQLGVIEALDDRPRGGRDPVITPAAKTWLLCRKPNELGYLLKLLDTAYPADTAIEIILDNHSAHVSGATTAWLAAQPTGRFTFTCTPTHGSWLNLIGGFFSKLARSMLRHIRVASNMNSRRA
jgi:transposase